MRFALPIAARVLARRLRRRQVALVLARYALASLRDPLADISTAGWPADREALVRHQLRAAVRLDDATRALGLDEPTRRSLVGEIVAQTGARFVASMLRFPEPATWLAASRAERIDYLRGATGRFFNAEMSDMRADDEVLGFDVCACRFVQLTTRLGRPYLAPMFCRADSVMFDRPDAPATLRRTTTLATGGPRCDFRFELE